MASLMEPPSFLPDTAALCLPRTSMKAVRRIEEIEIGRRFRKELGDLKALAESIEEVGLLHR